MPEDIKTESEIVSEVANSGPKTSALPNKPDPFWPEGAVPTHLSPIDKRDLSIAQAYSSALSTWKCEKCGTTIVAMQSVKNAKYCNECYLTEVKNSTIAKQRNADWVEQSEAIGLALFERQPEETDNEWRIWTKYREYYPLRMPTWKELADACDCCVATALNAAQRWSFRVRLQAWARYSDDNTMQQRIKAIKAMNERQLTMAVGLQEKLGIAIEHLDPLLLAPKDIVGLFKVATELDRRITTALPETVEGTATEATSKLKQMTKQEDIGEVIAILQKTGVLHGKAIGVETTTTRFIAKEQEN